MENNNNIGCKYVFKQGKRKNQVCGAGCRGDFCTDHKPTKISKWPEYYQKKKAKAGKSGKQSRKIPEKSEEDIEILERGETTVPFRESSDDKLKIDTKIDTKPEIKSSKWFSKGLFTMKRKSNNILS